MIALSTKYQSPFHMNQEEFDSILKDLSPREKQVLKLRLLDYKYSAIAAELGLEIKSIGSYVSFVYKKFKRSREHGYLYPRDELIALFYEFKRNWVHPNLYKRLGYHQRADEYFDIKSISPNHYLKKGVECFNAGKYEEAINLYEKAIDADDPIPQILLNNARSCLQGELLNTKPLHIAVVVSFAEDYHRDATGNVLRGVADAQDKFNNSNGKNGRLLVVIIADDHNQPKYAEKIARDLSNDKDILGIIGHHSSEGSQAALPIYEEELIAMISPSSTSSQLKSKVFFRTIGSTKIFADRYANYVKKYLNLAEIIVFYHKGNVYSQALKNDFEKAFKACGGKIIGLISNIDDPFLDIKTLIEEIGARSKDKAVLVISTIETNSVPLAIASINREKSKKIQLLFCTSLPEMPTLERGREALEGVVFVHPDLAEESDYVKQARKRWQQEINWRVATSYDATQALIEAIRLSKKPTREEILNNLEVINLPADQTSGFGLNWSDSDYHSNAQLKYCINQVRNKKFERILEE